MGKGRGLVLGLGLVLAGVLAAALLLLEDSGGGQTATAGGAVLDHRPSSGGPADGRRPELLPGPELDETALTVVDQPPAPPLAHDPGQAWLQRALLRDQRLSGRVVDEEGEPVAGVEVLLLPDADRMLLALSEPGPELDPDDFGVVRARSQADGHFALSIRRLVPPDRVARGSLTLLAVDPDHGRSFRTVATSLEVHQDVGDLTLKPGLRVTGRLVDEQSRPLGGVEVTWASSYRHRSNVGPRGAADDAVGQLALALADRPSTVRSGADGRFELPCVAEGWGTVRAFWQGGPPVETERFRLDRDDGEQHELGDLEIPTRRVLTGRVTDDTGQPLADARVFVTHVQPPVGALGHEETLRRAAESGDLWGLPCDAEGAFLVQGLDRSIYSLYAVAPGRATVRLDGLPPDGAPLTVSLPPVEGWPLQVVDEQDQPLDDVELLPSLAPWRRSLALRAGQASVPAEPVTSRPGDTPGLVLLAGAAPEAVVLEARGEGRVAHRVAGHELVKGEDGLRRLVLVRTGRLEGRVSTGPEALPVVGARVDLAWQGPLAEEDQDDGGVDSQASLENQVQLFLSNSIEPPKDTAVRVAMTDDDGGFRFDQLPRGRWKAHVRAEGFLEYEGAVQGEAEIVSVTGGEEPDRLDVTLHRASVLEGVVLTHTGEPAVRKRVRLAKGPLRIQDDSRYDLTDRAGRFAFEQLEAGLHTAWTSESRAVQVEISPSRPGELQLVLPPPARVQGRLLYADGTPARGTARFWVADPDDDARDGARDQRRSAKVDEEGRFSTELRGDGTLWVRGYGEARQTTAEQSLTVAPGGAYSVELRFLDTRLAGQVVDEATDAGLDGARLSLRTDGQRLSLRGDDQGCFEVRGLKPGTWRLSASRSGYDGRNLSDIVVSDPDAPAAEPAPQDGEPGPGPAHALRVVLSQEEASATLRGTVVQHSGLPAYDGTRVTAERVRADGTTRRSWGGPSASTRDGAFVLENVDPGQWELVVRGSVVDAEGKSQQVELVRWRVSLLPGDDQRVDLQLAEPPEQAPPPEPPDAKMLEALQSLGYVR